MWGSAVGAGAVIGADANNGGDPTVSSAQNDYETGRVNVNSRNHEGDGQNVLYGGGNVLWQGTAYCGDNDDNIYTSGPGAGTLNVRPTDLGEGQDDTVLIPPSSEQLKNWQCKP